MSDMGGREFISLLGAVAAWPVAARAQQTRIPVVVFLQRSDAIRSDFASGRAPGAWL